MKRWVILILTVIAVVALIGFVKVRQVQATIAGFASAPEPQFSVSSVKAAYLDWESELTAVGSLRAVRGVDLTTEVAGMVASLDFTSGAEVRQGQRLVQLVADADQARLQTLKVAVDLAEVNVKRDRQQREADAISQAQLDSSQANLASAKAQYAEQAAMVAKKSIRAPFNGRLGITTVNRGQYLNPGDAIVTLQQLDPIHADFNLPQQALAQLKVGQKVRLRADSYPDTDFTGTVTAIDPIIDPDTRNVRIQATIENRDRRLLPGMFASVNVAVGEPMRYLTVPQTAVTFNPYGETMFVVVPRGQETAEDPNTPADLKQINALAADDAKRKAEQTAAAAAAEGKPAAAPVAPLAPGNDPPPLVARQVFVTVGPTRGDQIAILSGLKEGDEVVTSGQLKIKTGVRVAVNNSVQPAFEVAPVPTDR